MWDLSPIVILLAYTAHNGSVITPAFIAHQWDTTDSIVDVVITDVSSVAQRKQIPRRGSNAEID